MFIYYIFSVQGPSQQHIQTWRFYLKKTKNNDAFILRWILSTSVGRVPVSFLLSGSLNLNDYYKRTHL